MRIYREYEQDSTKAVRREYAALAAVSSVTDLAPKLILADLNGEIIGDPLIVMSFFPARRCHRPDAEGWVRQMADGLIAVHETPLTRMPAEFRRGEPPAERVARIVGSPPESRRVVGAGRGRLPRAATA